MSVCSTCGNEYGPQIRICPRDGTILEDDSQFAVGEVLDGKYRLEARLGRGGMGTIYRATHLMLGTSVAVKLINRHLITSPEIARRFQGEARAARLLAHPNIAIAHDLGQAPDGTLYIVMELVEGMTLRDIIEAEGPLDARRIVHLLRQVADALMRAHDLGIIHRDLKPQNIMVTPGKHGEIVKLLDFGIAKNLSETGTQLTDTGHVIGTPQYMSPEQISRGTVDGRSDLYALGVILYQMLTGEVPFDDPSTPAVFVRHLTETPQRPSVRRADLPISAGLETIALRCLEKNRDARFPSVLEFSKALAVVRLDGPAAADVSAPPPVVEGPKPVHPPPPLDEPHVDESEVTTVTRREPLTAPASAANTVVLRDREPTPGSVTLPATGAEPTPAPPSRHETSVQTARRNGTGRVAVLAGLAVMFILLTVWAFHLNEGRLQREGQLGGSAFLCASDLFVPATGRLVTLGCRNSNLRPLATDVRVSISLDHGQTWRRIPLADQRHYAWTLGGMPGAPVVAVGFQSIYRLDESSGAWQPLRAPKHATTDVESITAIQDVAIVQTKAGWIENIPIGSDTWVTRSERRGKLLAAVVRGNAIRMLTSDGDISTDSGQTWSTYRAGLPDGGHLIAGAVAALGSRHEFLVIWCPDPPRSARSFSACPKSELRRLASTADGPSWNRLEPRLPLWDLSDSGREGGVLWASNGYGIHRSDDAGTTWQTVLAAKRLVFKRVVADPQDMATAYAPVDGAVLTTRDAGRSWTCGEYVSGACEFNWQRIR